MGHLLTKEEVGLAADEAFEKHFNWIFEFDYVVLHAVEDYSGAGDALDDLNVVETFFQEEIGDSAAELTGNMTHTLDRTY